VALSISSESALSFGCWNATPFETEGTVPVDYTTMIKSVQGV